LDDLALAVFFHDAVYDATRTDNEARSAALLVEEARGGSPSGERLERIVRMIAATTAHAPSDDPATQALLDLDLAILGAGPAAYGAYAAAIRREYAHVPEPLWRAGRAAVLERFLARERIYGSPAFAPLEAAARANLSAERAALLSRAHV
jgi:predicted metal-dependent HD superfamily phosphohydrolase